MNAIETKQDLKKVLDVELNGYGFLRSIIRQQYTYIFIYSLRKMEYYYNIRGRSRNKLSHILLSIYYMIWHAIWRRWSLKTGITIPKNTCLGGGNSVSLWLNCR